MRTDREDVGEPVRQVESATRDLSAFLSGISPPGHIASDSEIFLSAELNEDIRPIRTRTQCRRSGTNLFGGSGGAQKLLKYLYRRLRQ